MFFGFSYTIPQLRYTVELWYQKSPQFLGVEVEMIRDGKVRRRQLIDWKLRALGHTHDD